MFLSFVFLKNRISYKSYMECDFSSFSDVTDDIALAYARVTRSFA